LGIDETESGSVNVWGQNAQRDVREVAALVKDGKGHEQGRAPEWAEVCVI
jgi:hypothetical protein